MAFRNKICFWLCLLLCVTAKSQTQEKTIVVDSLQRQYRIYMPPSLEGPAPLVLNFHGLNTDAFIQELYTQMNAVADTGGFILVYPQGIAQRWNVGIAGLEHDSVDDVGFVEVLLDTLLSQYPIDTNRIYATGMSLGGFMSYRLACELSHRIAAVASVAGLMSHPQFRACRPGRPVPVMHIHGVADPVVAYNGDREFVSVDSVMSLWKTHNHCAQEPVVSLMPDRSPGDGTLVLKLQYACDPSAEVVLYMVQNGGHTWPGGFPIPTFGLTCYDIQASGEIWNFLRQFSLQGRLTGLLPARKEEPVRLFPNPFGEKLNLQSNSPLTYWAAYDLMGRKLAAQSVPGTTSLQLPTSSWPPGWYVLKLRTTTGWHTFRLQKY